jgi:hypothetical protein
MACKSQAPTLAGSTTCLGRNEPSSARIQMNPETERTQRNNRTPAHKVGCGADEKEPPKTNEPSGANEPDGPRIETDRVDQTNPARPALPWNELTRERRDPSEANGADEPSDGRNPRARRNPRAPCPNESGCARANESSDYRMRDSDHTERRRHKRTQRRGNAAPRASGSQRQVEKHRPVLVCTCSWAWRGRREI